MSKPEVMLRKIAVASDSFKGSLTSLEVAHCVERAVHDVLPGCEVVAADVADGGEGTMDTLQQALGGEHVTIDVKDPLGRIVPASYSVLADGVTAVVEMASASGLTLLAPDERNPLKTSTYGTGQLIRNALDRGCRKFLAGIGGSATNDAGMGVLSALGYRFLDASGVELAPSGETLKYICTIDGSAVHPYLSEAEFIVACDVTAPLYGPEGAAYVYAQQKGADPQMVEALDEGLRHFAGVAAGAMGRDCSHMPGAGAAGGLGYAFRQFLDARLESGVEMVLGAIGFDNLITGADLVITGEGCIDGQTLTGKAPCGIARHAMRLGVPVLAIGGKVCIDKGQASEAGFMDVLQITPPDMPLAIAMKKEIAAENVYKAVSTWLQKPTKEKKA